MWCEFLCTKIAYWTGKHKRQLRPAFFHCGCRATLTLKSVHEFAQAGSHLHARHSYSEQSGCSESSADCRLWTQKVLGCSVPLGTPKADPGGHVVPKQLASDVCIPSSDGKLRDDSLVSRPSRHAGGHAVLKQRQQAPDVHIRARTDDALRNDSLASCPTAAGSRVATRGMRQAMRF